MLSAAAKDILGRVLKPFWCAVGFLTRLPVPAQRLSDEEVAKSAGFFAWVGLLLSAGSYGLVHLLTELGSGVVAVVVVAGTALVTGGLHLDGLADTADGLSGGRGDRARTLEIMRDSRIGAHGASALVLALLLHTRLLESLIERGDLRWLWAPLLSRLASTVLLWRFPYARSQGLGAAFAGRVGPLEVGVGALALLPGLLVLPFAWAAAATTLAVALLFASFMSARLGGLTGDVHGAAIELSELACLGALLLT